MLSESNGSGIQEVITMAGGINIVSGLAATYPEVDPEWIYPEQFQDLDPEEIHREYFEEWLGVPYQGIWAYPQ